MHNDRCMHDKEIRIFQVNVYPTPMMAKTFGCDLDSYLL